MKTFKLDKTERINHIAVGVALIMFTLLRGHEPLGWLAILPLVATLPIFCGLFGYDPLSKLISQKVSEIAQGFNHHNSHRPHLN